MRESQCTRLNGFLEERLPPEAWGDFSEMLEALRARYDEAGPDDTEVAMRTIDLINFLDARLPVDEMERVRKIIFGTDDQGNVLSADAALRVRCGIRADEYARQRVAQTTGVNIMATDSAEDAYRLGLSALGHDPSTVPESSLRSVFEGFLSKNRSDSSASADLATRLGVAAPRKLG